VIFLQAEDGIRDATVTGVQTCALPISETEVIRRRPLNRIVPLDKLGCGDFPISEAVDEVIVHHSDCLHMCVYNSGTHEAESAVRSEERRVGKGRSAGA